MFPVVANRARQVPPSRAAIKGKARRANIILRQGQIDERFKSVYDKLLEVRNALERLSLTQAWSLRETDLYNYQRQLDRIDEGRVK